MKSRLLNFGIALSMVAPAALLTNLMLRHTLGSFFLIFIPVQVSFFVYFHLEASRLRRL